MIELFPEGAGEPGVGSGMGDGDGEGLGDGDGEAAGGGDGGSTTPEGRIFMSALQSKVEKNDMH